MQFEDPKNVLEAAAAAPSRPADVAALVTRGTRMRRARFGAAAAGLAVVVAGASASFGLLGTDRERGSGPAGKRPACESSDLSVVIFLQPDATDADIAMLRKDLERNPDVAKLEYVSREDAWHELQELDAGDPLRVTVSPDALPASFRIEAANVAAAERLADATSPGIDEVLADPGGESFACFVEKACARPAPPSVALYLRDDAAPDEVERLKADLRADPGIAGLKHVTKREAYDEFRELYSDQPAMWENLPRDALPASLRIEVVDEEARERIASVESPVIDEVVKGGDLIAELCPDGGRDPEGTASPAPEPSSSAPDDDSVPPPELGAGFGDHVNDVFITMDEAECGTTPSWVGAPPPERGKKWCRFKVSIVNLSEEAFEFDTRQQLLQTMEPTHIYRPRQPDTVPLAAVGDLFQERVGPGQTGGGWLVYRLRAGEEPGYLTITAPGVGSASGRAGAFGCREALAVDGGRCSYWSDRALVRFRYVTSVELYHCGVEPLSFGGRRWVSDPPPFDATNAPADFTGTGIIELLTEREAVYVDSSGAEIELRADEEWEPPPCA